MIGREWRISMTCAVFVAFSYSSKAWSICLPEEQGAALSLTANRGVMELSGHDRRESVPDVETPVGDLSFQGGNPLVYESFAGCGRRARMAWADSRVRVSYAKAANAAPFAGFEGQSFKSEEFLDAELTRAVGTFGDAGVTASAHATGAGGAAARAKTAGAGFWLTDAENLFALSSNVAVNGNDTAPAQSFAHRHRLALKPLSFGSGTLSGAVSFSEADADFHAERSNLEADRRILSIETKLDAGDTGWEISYTKARDNVADLRRAPTRSWQEVGSHFSWGSMEALGVPGTVALRAGFKDEHQRSANGDLDADQSQLGKTWGVSSRWGDSALFAGLDLGGSMSVNRSSGEMNEQIEKHRIALELGAGNRGQTFQALFFVEDEQTEIFGESYSPLDVGWTLSANALGQTFASSLVYRADTDRQRHTPWKWTFGAEIDAVRMLTGETSKRNWFAVAEIKTEVENLDNGVQTNFQTMLSSGVRF